MKNMTSVIRSLFLLLSAVSLVFTGCVGSIGSVSAPPALTITWPAPAAITYGTALSSNQLDATASVPGSFTYSPAAGAVLTAGSHTLMAIFTPEDQKTYQVTTTLVALTVNQAAPVITWATPAPIPYGTGLSSAQLNATANEPGSFTYSPAAFAYLGVGTQTLTATFTPTNSSTTFTASVPLTITLPSVPVDTATPPQVCTRPTPMPLPSTSHVVGNGSAASCTQAALDAAVASGGSITFNCGSSPATIPIASVMSVNSTTVIAGGNKITLDGGGVTRILTLPSFLTLSVRNMRFINAYGGGTPGWQPASYLGTEWGDTSGAAINGGYLSTLEVLNSIFQNNTSSFSSGGAISIGSMATVTIDGSVFDSNVGGYGGAIYSLVSNDAITNSIFTNNGIPYSSAGANSIYPGFGGAFNADGAGADINGGPPTISVCGSDFENNQNLLLGGAVSFWLYAPDQMIFDRNTYKNNISGNGGAMYLGLGWSDTPNTLGAVIVKNSTFVSNNAASGSGGGLTMICDGGTCSLTNSTFYENSAGSAGSDLNVSYDTSQKWAVPTPIVTLDNDTFAYGTGNNNSLSLTGSNYDIDNSVFLENGASICSIGGGAKGSKDLQYSPNGSTNDCIGGSILTADPDLANPANNGGPTWTMLPASTSPLIGAGSSCESTDQRGLSRNTSECTIGAVEVQ